jgi:hypothetical protein
MPHHNHPTTVGPRPNRRRAGTYLGLALGALAMMLLAACSSSLTAQTPTPAPPVPSQPALTFYYNVPPATMYVDPVHGSDGNSGRAPDQAFRTVQKAADVVVPGDVVYLEGGTYPIQVNFTRSGTQADPIVWASAPGQWAVFDGSDQTPIQSTERVRVTGAAHNVFANLEVRDSPQEGILVQNAHDNTFINIWTHGNEYSGITNIASDRNHYGYIVSYDNYDLNNPSGRIGDDADGISISSGDSNVIYGSLVFYNSDDGVDTWRSTNTLVDHVISHDNGRGPYGNGNGIKAGGNGELEHTVVRDSIAFNNRSNGFNENSGLDVHFYNDTAFNNGLNAFTGGSTTVLRNDIASGPVSLFGSDAHYNSWNLGITDPHFASTDPSQPNFLSLAAGSPAIAAGTYVGIPFSGDAPDLGALPYQSTYAALIAPLSVSLASLDASAPAPTSATATR